MARSDSVQPRGSYGFDQMLASRRARLETMTPEQNARFEAGKMLGAPLSEPAAAPGAGSAAAAGKMKPISGDNPSPVVPAIAGPSEAITKPSGAAARAMRDTKALQASLGGEPAEKKENWFDRFSNVLGKVRQGDAPHGQNAPTITASPGNGGQGGSLSGALTEEAKRRQSAPTYYDKFMAMFKG